MKSCSGCPPERECLDAPKTFYQTQCGQYIYELRYYPRKNEVDLVVRDITDCRSVEMVVLSSCGPQICCTQPPCPIPCHPGEKGAKGDHGCKGESGSKGEPGPEGPPGPKGSKGEPDGEKGDKGSAGPKGGPGEKGDKGDPDGEKGDKGSPGPKGDHGDKGEVGPKGSPGGEKGSKGDAGEKGVKGEKGKDGKGEKGDKGDRGEKGRGEKGNKGDRGEKGKKGCGEKGERGCPGPGFRYCGCYDPIKTYCYGDVVRINCDARDDCKKRGKLYVYVGHRPSSPELAEISLSDCASWKLFLKDGKCCRKPEPCSPSSSCTVSDSCVDSSVRELIDKYAGCETKPSCRPSKDCINLRYCGLWEKHKKYAKASVVHYHHTLALALKDVPKGAPPTEKRYWFLIGGSHREPERRERQDDNSQNQLEGSIFETSGPVGTAAYASKQLDVRYLPSSSRKKWSIPIVFEKAETNIPQLIIKPRTHTVFRTPGIYRVTVHVSFKGINLFRTVGYLLPPGEDPNSSDYRKNRKLPASKMSAVSGSTKKGHLNYSFPVTINEPGSTLVMTAIHHQDINTSDDREIIIYGEGQTWILIERV